MRGRSYGPSQGPTWALDPYGMAMAHIVSALERAEALKGKMSEEEYQLIVRIRNQIQAMDPSTWENVRRLQRVGRKPSDNN